MLDRILEIPTWIRSTSGAGYYGDRPDHWAQVLTILFLSECSERRGLIREVAYQMRENFTKEADLL